MKTTTNKQTFIRNAYKAIKVETSRKHKDCDWRGVKKVVEKIIDSDPHVTLYLEGTSYQGTMGEVGYSKVYDYTIVGCDKPVKMQLIASFCGTVADITSSYDITVLMN